MFPFFIFVFLFSYVPLFGWFLAFTDYRTGMILTDAKFIGFINFIKMYQNKNEILRVLRNTFAMSGLGLLTSPLPIIMAILLNEVRSKKLLTVIQATTTLPNFISWIVVFGFAFSVFSINGLLNTLLGFLGLPQSPTGLLGDAKNVWFVQLGLVLWKNLGWNTIIYLAAISGIDQNLYEAAKIDGANKTRCVRYITIPGVMPTFFVLLLLQISYVLSNGFDQYFIFYNPMVADKIEVLDYYVYKIGILINDYPYSIAIGMTRALISIFLLFIANYGSKKIQGHAIF